MSTLLSLKTNVHSVQGKKSTPAKLGVPQHSRPVAVFDLNTQPPIHTSACKPKASVPKGATEKENAHPNPRAAGGGLSPRHRSPAGRPPPRTASTPPLALTRRKKRRGTRRHSQCQRISLAVPTAAPGSSGPAASALWRTTRLLTRQSARYAGELIFCMQYLYTINAITRLLSFRNRRSFNKRPKRVASQLSQLI